MGMPWAFGDSSARSRGHTDPVQMGQLFRLDTDNGGEEWASEPLSPSVCLCFSSSFSVSLFISPDFPELCGSPHELRDDCTVFPGERPPPAVGANSSGNLLGRRWTHFMRSETAKRGGDWGPETWHLWAVFLHGATNHLKCPAALAWHLPSVSRPTTPAIQHQRSVDGVSPCCLKIFTPYVRNTCRPIHKPTLASSGTPVLRGAIHTPCRHRVTAQNKNMHIWSLESF